MMPLVPEANIYVALSYAIAFGVLGTVALLSYWRWRRISTELQALLKDCHNDNA